MAPRRPTRRRIPVRPVLVALLVLVLGPGPIGTGAAGAAPAQEPTTTTLATDTTLPGTTTPGTGTPPGAEVVGPVPQGPITAQEYIVVDADTGEILAGQDEHVAVLAASTVKTMTALLAMDLLGPDAMVTVPTEATAVACNCLDGFQAGQTWRVRDLLGGLLIGSNNDVAYALAIGMAGSVDGFAARAAQLGARLGTTDSSFTDPAGLDGAEGYRGGTLVSAHDLAILARNLLAVPELADLVDSRTAVITRPDGTQMTIESSNQLVGSYDGAIGVKTGFTSAARASLVGAATRDGRTIVTVVLGAEETFDLTGRLLDLGFATPPGSGIGEYLPTVRMGPAAAPFDGAALVLAAATSSEQTSSDGEGGGGGGGGLPVRMIVIVVLVLLLVLVVIRRRAVVRRRRARARQRQFHDARRRYLRTAEPDPEGPTVRPKALRQDR
jgi:serine-type D-Ala-D-Ala carboxypeptidase (penicillin-binding protein 5/6)